MVKWMYREFGRRLRIARRRARLSQEALAKSVGLARTSITNIEKGRQPFTLHTAYDLAKELGVRVTELIPEHPAANAESAVIPAKDRKKYKQMMRVPGTEEWVNRVIQSGTPMEVIPNDKESRTSRDGDTPKVQS
jgi:transcriptional regulator with XRE-family HTH domain